MRARWHIAFVLTALLLVTGCGLVPDPVADAGRAPDARPPDAEPPGDAGDPVAEAEDPLPAAPAAAGEAAVAVYSGWANADGVDAFGAWLERPVLAHDFLDHRQGWDAVADPAAQLDTWGSWVADAPDRRLVLSVPLLIESVSGDHAGGADGAYDDHFRRLAQGLVDRGLEDTIIRLGWEFNGNTFPWQVRPAQVDDYRRFWARVVETMRGVPGAAFAFDWCPNITLDATGLPFEAVYPGDDVVDIIGLGFYDYYWGHPDASSDERWAWLRDVENGLADHRRFAAGRGKPISFPEWGLWERGTWVGGGGDDPAFVARLAEWIADSDVAYHGYNDVDATADHRLTSYPESREVFREVFGR